MPLTVFLSPKMATMYMNKAFKTRQFGLLFVSLCMLAAAVPSMAQTTLVSTGAVWKYLDDGSDQGTAWKESLFPGESSWSSGPAPLGFGDGDEATTNLAGEVTYYYRHTFNVANPASFTSVRLRLMRDDGAIVYLNGTELLRDNMTNGAVDYLTFAASTASDDGRSFSVTHINPSLVLAGNNVLAVEVHQANATSSDVRFALELIGNARPSISISSPTNGQTIIGSSATISGAAVAGGPGAGLVEAYAGTTKVGQSTNFNFAIAWQDIAPGTYALTAKITDGAGLMATSAPVNVTIQAPPAGILIARRSSWKYHNLNSNLFTLQPTWANIGYDDSAANGWAGPAPGPLGNNVEGGVQQCATVIDIGTGDRIPAVFYRRTFNVSSPSAYQLLTLRIQCDDSAVLYLNGSILYNDGADNPGTFAYSAGRTLAGADETTYREFSVSSTGLVAGVNVLGVANYNVNNTSSDLQFDLEIEGFVDSIPPTATVYTPTPGSILLGLNSINVIFSEAVVGINASDLLINGEPATNMVTFNPNDFTFHFATPSTGVVTVAWAPAHGITDNAPLANPFAGGQWTYTYDPNASTRPNVIITEFMAQNDSGIRDEDGNRRDWIELYNVGPLTANLAGFFLTHAKDNLTEWRFPSVTLPANQYMIVWASEKNKTNSLPLHTNFRLDGGGGYLALVDPQTNVVSEFDPYPGQSPDVSYGRDAGDPDQVGFFASATPGAQNSTDGSGFVAEPTFSLATGVYTNDTLTLTISSPAGGEVRYTQDGSVPHAGSPLYTAPITINQNRTIKARVFLPGSGLLPSPVESRTFVLLDPTTRNFNSNIPLMVLCSEGQAIPQNLPAGSTNRAKGSLVVIDTKYGQSTLRDDPDFHGLASFEVVGQTSAGFSKRPYRIEVQDELGRDRNVGLLGMPEDADWRLRNPHSDKCQMNDFLANELFTEMGGVALRHRMVEVFVDSGGGRLTYPDDYVGIMVLFETIEVGDERIDIAKLTPSHTNEPAISGGWVIKYDKDSSGDIEIQTAGGGGFARLGNLSQTGRGLKIHEPKPTELATVLGSPTTTFANLTDSGKIQVRWLTNWLAQMERSLYAANWRTATGTNHWSHYIDADSFIDQHWIVEFPKQIDGYRLSNYMHKDRNGKLKMSPIWDWNLSFGNADYLEGGRTNGWYFELASELDHPWLRRLICGTTAGTGTTGDPDFNQRIADRWGVLRTNIMNGQRVLSRIDEIANVLSQGPMDRNIFKYNPLHGNNYLGTYHWPNPPGNPANQANWHVNYWVGISNYGQIIGEMKKWTMGRFLWIDSTITAPPVISSPGGMVEPGHTVTLSGPPGAAIYYTLDGTDPRGWFDPATGTGVAGATNGTLYTGPITINGNARIVARAREANKFRNTWSGPSAVTLYTEVPPLRITEIMYHPADPQQPSAFRDEDFEFIEVRNTSGSPLNISGYRIRGGIDFVFPNITLTAGQRAVVVKNRFAFSALYNTNGMVIAGEFQSQGGNTNNLDNTGERLVLEGRFREQILDFRYDDDWYKITDGLGFSLVIANDSLPPDAWKDPANWRVGGVVHGTPGAPESAATIFPRVVINEVLSHTDEEGTFDTVELRNLDESPADVSHWWLSDDRLAIKKFQIPASTIIPAGGHITFDELTMGFSFSANGDEAYLASANAAGQLTGYLHGFNFEAQRNGVTFGRHVTSVQKERFVAQSASTLSTANAGPLIGNVVISEVHFNPQQAFGSGTYWNNTDDEYIELHNRSGATVNLHHPNYPNMVWKLEKAAEFDFPPGTSIPAGGYIVVVNFNPVTKPAMTASFRSRFNVPAQVPILGPLRGDLSNDDETVALYQPDNPVTNVNGVVEFPYVMVEEVQYDDETPWPASTDAAGSSLQRRMPAQYSDDPISWGSGWPSPGRAYSGGAAPTISSQPPDASIVEGNTLALSVTGAGPGPLRYQWRKDGAILGGQTNSSLNVFPTTTADTGDYQVFVMNDSGFAASRLARVTVRPGVRIVQHPQSITVRSPSNVTFSVTATSTNPPITYQWKFNGQDIPGATSSTLVIPGATNIHDGFYQVVCTDINGPVPSLPARLTVLLLPRMVWPSPAAPLQITAVAGDTISFSAELHGTLPIFTRWRLTRNSGGTISGTQFGAGGDAIHEDNFAVASRIVATNDSGRIIINLTNIAGGSLANNAVVTNAFLTVLADSDGDRIPDIYEQNNGLNANDASDANGDLDGDTSKNRDEYIAGTNPRDATSYLKVDRIEATGAAVVHFSAVANRSYTVQYTDDLSATPTWQRLGDVAARPANWSASLADPDSSPKRFYRLVTPAQ